MVNIFKNFSLTDALYCIVTFILSGLLAFLFKSAGAPDEMMLVLACPVLAALIILFYEMGKSFFFKKKGFNEKGVLWGGIGAIVAAIVIGITVL